MDLDWTLETAGPVTLVRARLRNERATDRRVRLRNCLDGPVLPPRRHGTPAAGWDREGVQTAVPAGEAVALGYACPAPKTDPPVVVDDVGAVQEGDAPESTVDAAVRELGDHRPPRDVLDADGAAGTEATTAVPRDPHAGACDTDIRDGPGTAEPPTSPLPADADALLAQYRTRIETVEALNAASVRDATALLEANGGLAGVDGLGEKLDADASELRALAATAATLADRAQAATPPTEALRRLS